MKDNRLVFAGAVSVTFCATVIATGVLMVNMFKKQDMGNER